MTSATRCVQTGWPALWRLTFLSRSMFSDLSEASSCHRAAQCFRQHMLRACGRHTGGVLLPTHPENPTHSRRPTETDLEDVRSHLGPHLQHLLQVGGQLHVGLPPSHGEEAQGHFQRGQGLTHLTVGLQLGSHGHQVERLEGLLQRAGAFRSSGN